MGSNSQTALRYYYVYNGHGDVVNLADASGNIYASYTYDEYGVALSSSESFPGGWTNPYRYDGRDRVRYDSETSLYWMSVRAYDPTLGRFLSRDPLGRSPLNWASQPYVYAGNNPSRNVDPSGQRYYATDDESYSIDMTWLMHAQRVKETTGRDADPCADATGQCFRKWLTTAGGVRTNKLRPLHFKMYLDYGLGYFSVFLGDIIEAKTKHGLQKLEAWVDIVATLVNGVLPYFVGAAGDLFGNSNGYDGFLKAIAKPGNWLIGALHGAIAVAHSWGFFGSAVIDAASELVDTVGEGLPGIAVDVLTGLFGDMVREMITAGGHVLLAQAQQEQLAYDAQASMNLVDWCLQYGGCPTLPTS